MFETLQERLQSSLRRLSGRGVVREKDLDEALEGIRTALLEADAALPAVRELSRAVRERGLGREVAESVTPAQQVVQIVFEELQSLLAAEPAPPPLARGPAPAPVLLAGLQGSGKTTTAAKLARWLGADGGGRIALASLDLSRPAADRQLQLLAEAADSGEGEGKAGRIFHIAQEAGLDPPSLARRALEEARLAGARVVVLDSAGRTALDEAMMDELSAVHAAVPAAEALLVADAMTGQDAVRLAKRFAERLELAGVVLSRAEGDARGGAALSMRHGAGCPIRFLGTGEKPGDLEPFDAEAMARRILGFGDLLALVRAASEREDAARDDRLARRMAKGKFDLDDFAEQLRQLSGGSKLEAVLSALPAAMRRKGAAAAPDAAALARQLAILSSMTREERRRPELLQASRKRRIAAGSGTAVAEVNRLLKQHQTARTVVRRLAKSGPAGLQSMLAGGAGADTLASLAEQAGRRR